MAATEDKHRANYNDHADEYVNSKYAPWRIDCEFHTYFEEIGDVSGKKILDLACGNGLQSRALKKRGASKVVGVDISDEMIRLAREEEERTPLGLEYSCCDAKDLKDIPNAPFDLVVAAYLFCYAQTPKMLEDMVKGCFSALAPGGRLVTCSNNVHVHKSCIHPKYQFTKHIYEGKPQEGDPVRWSFYEIADDADAKCISIENYYQSPQVYEKIFTDAGFVDFQFVPIRVNPDTSALKNATPGFYDKFLDDQPICILTARKP